MLIEAGDCIMKNNALQHIWTMTPCRRIWVDMVAYYRRAPDKMGLVPRTFRCLNDGLLTGYPHVDQLPRLFKTSLFVLNQCRSTNRDRSQ